MTTIKIDGRYYNEDSIRAMEAELAAMCRNPRNRHTGVVHPDYGAPRMLFAYTRPDRRLVAVIDAEDIDSAWVIATGWGDQADIKERQANGWRLSPAVLKWAEDRE